MRKTSKPAAAKAATTVAGMLDELQDRQREARAMIVKAYNDLGVAFDILDRADQELIRTAELLGLPVED